MVDVRAERSGKYAFAIWLIGTVCFYHPSLLAASSAMKSRSMDDRLASALALLDGKAALDLYLELVVNGMPSGRVVPVVRQSGVLHIEARYLREAGVSLPDDIGLTIRLNETDNISSVYHETAQRLEITVPAQWLPRQQLGGRHARPFMPATSDMGGLLGYNIYGSHDNRQTTLSIWHEARVFGGFGTLSSAGNYRAAISGKGSSRYVRYDTSWRYDDEKNARTYEAGDLVTRTLSWNSAVRVAGFQFSRDFAIRPDIITYPLPDFTGSAALPGTAELFVNGHKSASSAVHPGPFSFQSTPYVNGAGDAVLVVTDMEGRRTTTVMPFYIATDLLRPGLADYALATGVLRRRFGMDNFSYGEPVATGSLRLGLTNALTGEAVTEMAQNHILAGGGGVFRLGNAGVVNLSGAVSRQHGISGYQISAGYRYTGGPFNLMARTTIRNRGFGDLSTIDTRYARLPSRQVQAHAGYILGGRDGSVGVSYLDSKASGRDHRLATVSYYRPVGRASSLQMSVSRQLGWRRATFAQVQLMTSFGNRTTASGRLERMDSGQKRAIVSVSQSLPLDGGFGWSAATIQGDRDHYQADMSWRTSTFSLRGGVERMGGGSSRQWGELSGAIISMDGGFFAANRISDGFVLVSTQGVAGVPVQSENMPVGKTNRRGHLVIPWVTSFYPIRTSIDVSGLPYGIVAPEYEKYTAVMRGGGRIVRFPLNTVRPAFLRIVDEDGAPIEAGADVRLDSGAQTWVGHDGAVYLDDAGNSEVLTITLTNGESCQAQLGRSQNTENDLERRRLTCR